GEAAGGGGRECERCLCVGRERDDAGGAFWFHRSGLVSARQGCGCERVRSGFQCAARSDYAAGREDGRGPAGAWGGCECAAEDVDADAAVVGRLELRADYRGGDALLAGGTFHGTRDHEVAGEARGGPEGP